jgi:hypothetical protein
MLTTLSVTPNPAYAGQAVTLKALVTGVGTPAGNVTFFDGATSICSGSLDGTGTAVLTTTNLQLGTHPLTATLGVTSNWGASSSPTVNEVIIPNPHDYTLTPNGSLTLRTEHHGSTVVTATPIGGLSDTVSISCGALPIYVTCEVVPSSHAPGRYSIVINGHGQSTGLDRTTTLNLTLARFGHISQTDRFFRLSIYGSAD